MDLTNTVGIIGIGVALVGVGVMFFPPSHLSNKFRLWIAYPLIISGIIVILLPFFMKNKIDNSAPARTQSKLKTDIYITSPQLISDLVEKERRIINAICKTESEKVIKKQITDLDENIKPLLKKDKEFIDDFTNIAYSPTFIMTTECTKPEMTYVFADVYFRIIVLEKMLAKIQRKQLGAENYKQKVIEELNSNIFSADLIISKYVSQDHLNWIESVEELLEVNKKWPCFGSDYIERFSHVPLFPTVESLVNQQVVLKDIVKEIRACR